MKILITNAYLEKYGGVEVVTRDLATELKRQGHQPVVYSPHPGKVAEEIGNAGIEIANDLRGLNTTPDIIHGHQFPELLEALLRFPSAAAVYVCHTATPNVDEPFPFPRILRYVAVDQRCKKRLLGTDGILPTQLEVIENAVDLMRFSPRPPLPAKPRRALVFSNYASRRTHLPAVRKACRRKGLKLDVMGIATGTELKNPESALAQYDLVFAKARCALEAMVTGCAVVLCDFAGAGSMVTTENFADLRPMNFGQGVLTNPLRAEYLETEIDRYNSVNATEVSFLARKAADLTVATRRWVQLYTNVLNEFHNSPRDFSEEMQAASDYLRVRSYEKRVEWEKEQARRLQHIPLIGDLLFRHARAILQRWTRN